MRLKKYSHFTAERIRKESVALFFNIFRLVFLIFIGYIVLYPLFYMITCAIKTERGFLDVSHMWLPRELTTSNFKTAYDSMSFSIALKQTVVLQIISSALEVMVCSFVAYGFARFHFPGKKVATFFLILSLLVPVQMYSLSLAVNYRVLRIFNTPLAYWLPALFGVGVRSGIMIFIYQQFFMGLPKELEDAAYVDGAGPIRTYFSIALPSSSVVIITNCVLAVIWHWNESYLAELCFMDENRPLAVVLKNLNALLKMYAKLNQGEPLYPAVVSAGCLLFLFIPLLFYMFVQRKFVKSIDRIGITG